MIIEKIETAEAPAKQEKEYEHERELVTLEAGQKFRNILLSETRSGSNSNGDYILVFLDTVAGEHYMMFVSRDMTEHVNIWGKQFIKKFLELDDETGYYLVKQEYQNKPLWFGKQAIKGKKYHNLMWGFEEGKQAPVNNEADALVKQAIEDGVTMFDAGKLLVDKLGMKPAAALDMAKKYYGE